MIKNISFECIDHGNLEYLGEKESELTLGELYTEKQKSRISAIVGLTLVNPDYRIQTDARRTTIVNGYGDNGGFHKA